MKHVPPVTLAIVVLFLVAQVIGLFILDAYIDESASSEAGELVFESPPFNIERPELEKSTAYLFIVAAIGIGTLLIFLLMKFKQARLWKVWYFLSIAVTLTVAFAALMPDILALILAVVLGLMKVLRPNFYSHNLSELFIYAGLAAIFVPLMNIFSVVMLLIIISAYDMYAVWKSKHMVKLAKFQSSTNIFAGLFIPYDKKGIKASAPGGEGKKVQTAILGGGDIGFPLLFTGVIMMEFGWSALIISFTTAFSLLWLLWKGKRDTFYPAMPYLSAGCFIGFGAVWLLAL
ncbi:MAG: presenilin family intramembrane aspartyl protease [Nanoarchaeota archaeon]